TVVDHARGGELGGADLEPDEPPVAAGGLGRTGTRRTRLFLLPREREAPLRLLGALFARGLRGLRRLLLAREREAPLRLGGLLLDGRLFCRLLLALEEVGELDLFLPVH